MFLMIVGVDDCSAVPRPDLKLYHELKILGEKLENLSRFFLLSFFLALELLKLAFYSNVKYFGSKP